MAEKTYTMHLQITGISEKDAAGPVHVYIGQSQYDVSVPPNFAEICESGSEQDRYHPLPRLPRVERLDDAAIAIGFESTDAAIKEWRDVPEAVDIPERLREARERLLWGEGPNETFDYVRDGRLPTSEQLETEE